MARAPGASVAADAAKTIVQAAASTASAGMQTSSGGGEGLAGSGAHAALQTPSTQPASHTQAAGQPRFTVAQQAAVDQVSVQISKAIKDGIDHINIQLRPQNLGRVDVRLEVTDGRVSATVTADSKETLDMLQKDARELERALQQAGLETDNSSLSFSLRGQQGQGQEGDRQVAGGRSGQESLAADDTTAETPAWTDYPGGIRPDGRIDIRA
ncbi:MAG: flagellar hook-length control protein FliK [Rhodospirillales bacterium]|nr:flagellar hook-length control protein FliK [Rhodospirillales bacterium]